MIALSRTLRFCVSADALASQHGDARAGNGWAGRSDAAALAPHVALSVTVAGEPHPQTGFLCDIRVLDDWLLGAAREAVVAAPTAGAGLLLRGMHRVLTRTTPAGLALVRIHLAPTPYTSLEIEAEHHEMILYSEQFEFSAAHRLHVAGLPEEENRRIFGKCNNPMGHGHNYVVEVTVVGEPDAAGRVVDHAAFVAQVRARLIDPWDHRHLNEDVADFRDLNPTVENIARRAWERLGPSIDRAKLHRVRVYETPKTWADYGAGAGSEIR